jgi:glycosyltransferase involved in cell wall biosynthesis
MDIKNLGNAQVLLFVNSTNSDLVLYGIQEALSLGRTGLNYVVFTNQRNLPLLSSWIDSDKLVISSYGPNSSGDILDIIKSIYLAMSLLVVKKHAVLHFTSVNIKNIFPLLLARFIGLRTKSTIHDVVPHEGRSNADMLFNKILVRLSNEFVVYSEYSKSLLRGLLGSNEKKIHLRILGGFDLLYERRQDIAKHNINTILIFGRLEKYKGLNIVIELARSNTDKVFHIYGRGNCASMIKEANLDNIQLFEGYIEDKELPLIFMKYHYIFLPYTSATQSGVVKLAQYFGCYPVATDVGAFSEQIENDNFGLLVNLSGWNRVFNILEGIYPNSSVLQKYWSKFTVEKCINQITKEYQ